MTYAPNENRCISCGRVIPDGRHVCLLCSGENELQSFMAKKSGKPHKYFCITDECGWKYYIATDNMKATAENLLHTAHVCKAEEITQSEFERKSL